MERSESDTDKMKNNGVQREITGYNEAKKRGKPRMKGTYSSKKEKGKTKDQRQKRTIETQNKK